MAQGVRRDRIHPQAFASVMKGPGWGADVKQSPGPLLEPFPPDDLLQCLVNGHQSFLVVLCSILPPSNHQPISVDVLGPDRGHLGRARSRVSGKLYHRSTLEGVPLSLLADGLGELSNLLGSWDFSDSPPNWLSPKFLDGIVEPPSLLHRQDND